MMTVKAGNSEVQVRTYRAGNVEVQVGIYANTIVKESVVTGYLEGLKKDGWRLPTMKELDYIQSLYGIKNLLNGLDNQGDYWCLQEKENGINYNCYDLFFCVPIKNESASAIFVREVE